MLGVFVLGLILLVVVHTWKYRTYYEPGAFIEITQDVVRDLGIAFIVSSIVGQLFELYRSLRHSIDSMKDVVDAVMADKLTKEVWFQLEDLIENKKVLRVGLRIRLELERDELLKPHEAKLRAEIDYEVKGIGRRPNPVVIKHDLDYQLTNSSLKLPRFERITIGRQNDQQVETYVGEDLNKHVKEGRFEKRIGKLKYGESVQVQVVREELVHVPGSYNLYTTEFSTGIAVNVAKLPDGVDAEVWVRPQGEGRSPAREHFEWRTDSLILPGQGVEIKFLASPRPQLP